MSGQLEKDLGLEASSARQAARLIIFESMRSFFLGSKEQATKVSRLTLGETHGICRTLAISVRALSHFNLNGFGFWSRRCREMHF
jgi:hypothetical protein